MVEGMCLILIHSRMNCTTKMASPAAPTAPKRTQNEQKNSVVGNMTLLARRFMNQYCQKPITRKTCRNLKVWNEFLLMKAETKAWMMSVARRSPMPRSIAWKGIKNSMQNLPNMPRLSRTTRLPLSASEATTFLPLWPLSDSDWNHPPTELQAIREMRMRKWRCDEKCYDQSIEQQIPVQL